MHPAFPKCTLFFRNAPDSRENAPCFLGNAPWKTKNAPAYFSRVHFSIKIWVLSQKKSSNSLWIRAFWFILNLFLSEKWFAPSRCFAFPAYFPAYRSEKRKKPPFFGAALLMPCVQYSLKSVRLCVLTHEKSVFCLPTKGAFFNVVRSCRKGR